MYYDWQQAVETLCLFHRIGLTAHVISLRSCTSVLTTSTRFLFSEFSKMSQRTIPIQIHNRSLLIENRNLNLIVKRKIIE